MKEITVIIPAAGLATRMRPLSNNLSKTLIPINGKPILSYIFDTLDSINKKQNEYKITKVFVVANNEDVVRYTNKENSVKSYSIVCTPQQSHLPGPGGAVVSGIFKANTNDNILIWLGDTICFKNDYDFSESFIVTNKVDNPNRWCVAYETNSCVKYYNKATGDALPFSKYNALIGIYFLKSVPNIKHLHMQENTLSEYEISMLLPNDVKIIDANNTWYDCGELDTYYKTCDALLSLKTREQTSIIAKDGYVKKIANKAHKQINDKLIDEYSWFCMCKGLQKLYIPTPIEYRMNNGIYSYTMSKRTGTTLADMLIYEDIPINTFKTILNKLLHIYHTYFVFDEHPNNVTKCFEHDVIFNEICNVFYRKKSLERIKDDIYTSLNTSVDLEKFINESCDYILAQQKNKKNIFSVRFFDDDMSSVHGDFHLGNILFDAYTGNITFLDPRGGQFAHQCTHALYDMAKLYHDIYVGYFLVLAEQYTIENGNVIFPENIHKKMKALVDFMDNLLENTYGYDIESIKRLAIILVITCLPFHKENLTRCKNFINIAEQLIKKEY